MMASVIRHIHDCEGPKQRAEMSLFQANSALNTDAHISSQPVTLVHGNNGGFETSFAQNGVSLNWLEH